MVQNVLVCTICRNLESNFEKYYDQLRNAVTEFNKDYNFFFSIYENDSTDKTKTIVKNADWSFFKDYSVETETLNVKRYHGNEFERVKILATARNKCLEAKNMLENMDWIIFIESDIEYTPEMFKNILKHDDRDIDIFSGIAVSKDTSIIYDLWATRYSQYERPDVEATIYNLEALGVKELWATFSCLCLYKAEPFKKGVRFHWMNERFGIHDCDTTVICENFRKAGYTKIFADYSINPTHPAKNLIAYAIHSGEGAEKLANFIKRCVRRTDDVVITDDPKNLKTREYTFELYPGEVPSVAILRDLWCVNSQLLNDSPLGVSFPIMNVELGNFVGIQENGATQWPYWEPRLYRRGATDTTNFKVIQPIGALSIWRVKSFI